MTRDFLKNLGLEDAVIDKVLDENMRDIGKEKGLTTTAQNELATAKNDLAETKKKLKAAQDDLETMQASNGDITAVQQKLIDLQAKYDTDTDDLKAQLADRDYSDAITRAITGKALKFSSKSAEKAFAAALREQKLELKDGELTGIDEFIKAQKEADPDAFAPDNPPARFLGGSGSGGGHGAPPAPVSRAAQLAAEHHVSLYGGETKKE